MDLCFSGKVQACDGVHKGRSGSRSVRTVWLNPTDRWRQTKLAAVSECPVWAATTEGLLHRFAPSASSVAQVLETDGEPNALAGDGSILWASDLILGRVLRVGPGGVEPIDVGVTSMEGPGPAVGFGSVWVGTGDNNTVIRIDASSKQVLAAIELEGWVEDVATGAGSVWVALPEEDRVVRIDPTTNQVTARIRVTGFPNAIAVGN